MLGVESRRADRSLQEAAYERLDHDSGRLRWILKHGILIDFKGSSCFHSFQAGPACRVATSASSRRCVCWATACSPSTPPPSCPCSSRYGSSGAHMICSEHAVPQMQVAWLCSAAGTLRKSLTPALSAPQSGTHWRLAGPALNAGWANPSTSLNACQCSSLTQSSSLIQSGTHAQVFLDGGGGGMGGLGGGARHWRQMSRQLQASYRAQVAPLSGGS